MSTNDTPTAACFACGGRFADIDGPTHRYMDSTPGCWAAFGRVLEREYSDTRYFGVHRLTVDTYAVQHPGQPSAQSIQSVGVHLIRLHLFLERGLSAEQANDAMLDAARFKKSFVRLEPPLHYAMTVADVFAASAPEQHQQLVRAWAQSAWQAWSAHHDVVRQWAERSGAAASMRTR